MKQIPKGIMHKPKTMAWAELTPLHEHKERESLDIQPEVIPYNGTKRDPLPLSRATTELRRAYTHIFDCMVYAKTHNPELIDTDLFYSRVTMPYHVFLDYCLDTCTEQTQYLKEEIYRLIKGQPAKYIKVSEEKTVLAQPVIIAVSHTDLKTGKEKRITNIGQDSKVDLVQVQILNELLDVSHGYINVPKAFSAKVKRAFNRLKEAMATVAVDDTMNYRDIVNAVKKWGININGVKLSTKRAIEIYENMTQEKNTIKKLEQGGYYAIYLALEYILVRKKKGTEKQTYRFLDLCEKCAPELVQHIDGKLYYKGKAEALAFLDTLEDFVNYFFDGDGIGINSIEPDYRTDDPYITVYFQYNENK